jgi:serine/threonine-protein kinase
MVLFWYRTSPDDLTPVRSSVATATDPPLSPGSLVLQLDQEGRLYSLDSLPGGTEGKPPIAAEPDPWSRAIEISGFPGSSLKPAVLGEEPLYYSDTRAAWLLPLGSDSLRIEAGMRAGRLSFFRARPDWLLSGKEHVESFNRKEEFFVVLLLALYLGILLAGIVLARRNLKNGRGDRKGAFRLGVLSVVLIVVTWLLGGSHSLTMTELRNATNTLGQSLFFGMGVYILYVALEPEVRRRWPQRIVSWARLLEGRFTDPMVGRDILIGAALGLTIQLLRNTAMYALRTSGVALLPNMNFLIDNAARGTPGVLNGIASGVFDGLAIGLAFYLLALLFTIVLRKEWLGILAFGAICIFGLYFASPGWYWIVQMIGIILWVAVFTRIGLLAWVVGNILFQLMLGSNYPRVADMSSWYMSDYIVYLSFIVFLAAWGAWWAARQPSVRGVSSGSSGT